MQLMHLTTPPMFTAAFFLAKIDYRYVANTPDTLAEITDVIVLTVVRICSVSDFRPDNGRFAAAEHRFSNGVPTTPFVTSISVSKRKLQRQLRQAVKKKRVSWDERETKALVSADQ